MDLQGFHQTVTEKSLLDIFNETLGLSHMLLVNILYAIHFFIILFSDGLLDKLEGKIIIFSAYTSDFIRIGIFLWCREGRDV